MRSNLLSSFVLGTYSFLGLYVLDIKAEVSVRSYPPSQVRQTSTFANRAEQIDSNLSPVNSIRSASSNPKLLKRAQKWTDEEEQRLLEFRDQQESWKEIKEFFPNRTWHALSNRYYKITRDLPTRGPQNPRWTDEEHEILLGHREMGKPWEELTELLPGRTATAIRKHYSYLTKGNHIPEAFKRRWTAEEDKLLQKLVEGGVPTRERMAYFKDRTLVAVQVRSKKFNRPKKAARPPTFTSEEDDLLIESLEEGKTLLEISQLLEKTVRGVRARTRKLVQLKRLDPPLQLPIGSKFTIADYELMSRMRKRRKTWKEIAERFPGRSDKTLRSGYHYYLTKERQRESE